MAIKKPLIVVSIFLLLSSSLKAQIEVANIRYKDFSSIGFGAFINVAIPISEADFITPEVGLYYASDKDDDNVGLIPFLLGYRYTLNRSGYGFYLEPNVGYSIGSADVGDYYESVTTSGITSGIGFGYLFEPTNRIQFNLSLRFERCFGGSGTNVFSFRIAHAFTFGRRD
jgi:hypothetical protein